LNTFRKLFVLSIVVAAILAIGVLPTLAQFDQDDQDQAVCIHVEINTGPTGEYIYLFLYQDEFNVLINSMGSPDFEIQVTEPNTTLVYNIVVSPQTLVMVLTPEGEVAAYVWSDGAFYSLTGGSVSFSQVDFDIFCRGAATDDRINRFDDASLAVIYHDGNGGYDIWKIDPATSDGTFDYNVTQEQVDAAFAAANGLSKAQVIGQGATSILYALPGGQCLLLGVNADGETQSFEFKCK
jgi:hypothetical protein